MFTLFVAVALLSAFEVQYSANGANFETIGTVPGNINSNQVNNYQFNTPLYQSGKNFYRLKQVDVDGHSTISSIAKIWQVRPKKTCPAIAGSNST